MKRTSDEEIRDYVALLQMGWNYRQVGEKYGKQASSIHSTLKRKGITFTNEDLELEVVSAYRSGMSSIQVGNKFGIAHATVLNYLKKHNVESRSLPEAVIASHSKPELASEYWQCYESGMSLSAVAKKYGVDFTGVYKLLKRHGYKVRSPLEGAQLYQTNRVNKKKEL